MKDDKIPSCEDVLEAFACETDTGRLTLERYLREYPDYAEMIIDFAAEISLGVVIRKEPLSEREQAMIEAGYKMHLEASSQPIADPFATLATTELRRISKVLAVPRQVLTAFRDRTIVMASIPQRFMRRLAAEVGTEFEALKAYLSIGPVLAADRSYKSEEKPAPVGAKTFEQVLIDACVDPEERKRLLADD